MKNLRFNLGKIKNKMISLIFKGEARTVKIKTNMLRSVFFKGGTVLFSFLIIKVTYLSLNEEKLGVWMSILSILIWISMFDVGLGNGLKNRLSESLAKDDYKQSKIYVSTTYAIIGMLVLILGIAFTIAIKYCDISALFNVNKSLESELKFALFWIVILYLVNFMLSLINFIALAFQDSAIPDIIRFCTNLVIFVAYFIVAKTKTGSLFLIGFLYSILTVLVILIASFYLFKKPYKRIAPSIKNINMKFAKSLFSLSIGFFIIQMSALVVFTTDNMIITQVLGVEQVFPYQVVYKLFNIFLIGFGIIITPLWSGFTESYLKKDSAWIKRTLRKLCMFMIPITLGVIVMIILTRPLIRLWIGNDVGASTLLIVLTGVYTIQNCWNSIFNAFVNGIGRIKLNVITAVIAGVLNIPLSVFFAGRCGLGSSGVILGTICSLMFASVILPLQTYRIIKKELR